MRDIALALLAQQKVLKPDDCIWCAGLSDWVRAGSVPGLIPLPLETYSPKLGRPDGPLGLNWPERQSSGFEREATLAGHDIAPGQSPIGLRRHDDDPDGKAPSAGGLLNMVASAVIAALDYHGIRTARDLLNDSRLRIVAKFTFDSLPRTASFAIAQTIGKDAFEDFVFYALIAVRERAGDKLEGTDLRRLILQSIESDWLERNSRLVSEMLVSRARAAYDALPSIASLKDGLAAITQRAPSGSLAGASNSLQPLPALTSM